MSIRCKAFSCIFFLKDFPLYFHVKIFVPPTVTIAVYFIFPFVFPYAGFSILSEYIVVSPPPVVPAASNMYFVFLQFIHY